MLLGRVVICGEMHSVHVYIVICGLIGNNVIIKSCLKFYGEILLINIGVLRFDLSTGIR